MTKGLPIAWREALTEWAATQHEVREVYVVGPRARGDHRDESGLDVVVVRAGTAASDSAPEGIAPELRWREQLKPRFPVPLNLVVASRPAIPVSVRPDPQVGGIRVYLMADPALKTASAAFHQMGWFLPPFYSRATLETLAEKIIAGGPHYPVDRFEAEVQMLFGPRSLTAMVLGRYPQDRVLSEFADSISQAVEAHLMGMNHVAVAGLMPVVEGAGRRLAVERGLIPDPRGHESIRRVFGDLIRDYRREVVEHGWGATDVVVAILNSFSEFLTDRFYAPSAEHGQADNTNRNGVLHGFYPDAQSGRALTFYKTLSAIDLLSFVGGMQTSFWMGTSATPNSDRLALAWELQGGLRRRRRAGKRTTIIDYLSIKQFLSKAMGVPFSTDLA
jgi:predicted nucleotidyltransferase